MPRPLALRNTALIASLLSTLGFYTVIAGAALGSNVLTSRGLYLLLASLPLQLYTFTLVALDPIAAMLGLSTACMRALLVTGLTLGLLYPPLLASIAAAAARIAREAGNTGFGVGLHCRQRWLLLTAFWPVTGPLLAARAAACIESLVNSLAAALVLHIDWESLSGVKGLETVEAGRRDSA